MKFVRELLIRLKKAFINDEGFSLLELMIAIVIISILSIGAFQVFRGVTDQASQAQTKQILQTLATALERYNLDNGSYPTTEQGLQALYDEPTTEPVPDNYNPSGYMQGNNLATDGWRNNFVYSSPGEDGNEYNIVSLGKDGKEGGEGYNADISVWDN
jgi:general secretion pathway protein G